MSERNGYARYDTARSGSSRKKERLWRELQAALAQHAKCYPHGDWKAANDWISDVRERIDREWRLRSMGYIDNGTLVKSLGGFQITGRKFRFRRPGRKSPAVSG